MKRMLAFAIALLLALEPMAISAAEPAATTAPTEANVESVTEAATEPVETAAPTEAATEPAETAAPTEAATEPAETAAPTEAATEPAETTAATEPAETAAPTEAAQILQPGLVSVKLEKAELTAGDKILVTAEAENAGNVEKIQLDFVSEAEDVLSCELVSKNEKFEGYLTADKAAAAGTYTLATVTLEGKENFRLTYGDEEGQQEFPEKFVLPVLTLAEAAAPTEAATEPSQTTAPTQASTEPTETTAPTQAATEPAEANAPTEEKFVENDGELEQDPLNMSKSVSLKAISIDKTTVQAPGTITITLDIEETGSGLKNGEVGIARASDYYSSSIYNISLNEETGKYQAVVDLGEYAEAGDFVVSSVHLYDMDDESRDYYYDGGFDNAMPSKIKFTIKNDHPDMKEPELISVSVTPKTITVPGKLHFAIDAKDDVSGISEMNLEYVVKTPDGREYSEFVFFDIDPSTNRQETDLFLSEYVAGGDAYVSVVRLSDKAGHHVSFRSSRNEESYSETLKEEVNFKIINPHPENEDLLPPELVSIRFDKEQMKVPGELKILAEFRDDKSGIANCNIGISRKEPNKQFMTRVFLDLNPETGLLEGTMPLSEYEAQGTIYVSDVNLTDNAGHYSNYVSKYDSNRWSEKLPNEAEIKIINDNPERQDQKGPELLSITVREKKITVPGSLWFDLDITDDSSGFEYGYIVISTDIEENGHFVYFSYDIVPNEKNGKYKVEIPFSKYHVSMNAFVSQVTLVDKAGHESVYKSNREHFDAILLDEEIDFSVKNPNSKMEDSTGPVLKSVKVNKSEVAAPGTFKVTVEATDNMSGIQEVYVGITAEKRANYYAEFYPIEMVKNESTGKFEGYCTVTPEDAGKSLWIVSVNIHDFANNWSYYCSNNSYPNFIEAKRYDDMEIKIVGGGVIETVPMYRLYNPYTQEHLLSSNEAEKSNLMKIGWKLDGIAWNSVKEGREVFRLYNPYDQSHLYTMNQTEIQNCLKAGWKMDGPICCSADEESGTPIYRLFNPYAKAHYHLYTASDAEIKLLTNAGWKLEGVAWYAAK